MEKFRSNKDGAGAFKALTAKYDTRTQIMLVIRIIDVRHLVILLHCVMEKLSIRLIGEPSNKRWWLCRPLKRANICFFSGTNCNLYSSTTYGPWI
ncbi:hypothetical protein Naga_100235g4 [Nannochloropsis gaditana]|uniref:Uncharacterized protein n=1 Tax=Nannochloropsis gaditana TaxID=72520 RepID=W7T097_9STRA|nr:hypothetical protein Naga_100235g4 [Nannochloropsis gaditana]